MFGVNASANRWHLNHFNYHHPLIISHRGCPFKFPEHSLSGYNYAMKHGSKFIEQDITTSKDGHLFDSHDNNLKRTTNSNIDITKMNYKQVELTRKSNSERILTLPQLFKRYGNKTNYVIETKKSGKKSFYMERQIIHEIRHSHLQHHVILQSMKQSSLNYMHKRLPHVVYMRLLKGKHTDKQIGTIPKYIKIVSPQFAATNSKIVHKLHRERKLAMPYCIDSKKQVKVAKRLKYDGFFSDDSYYTSKFY